MWSAPIGQRPGRMRMPETAMGPAARARTSGRQVRVRVRRVRVFVRTFLRLQVRGGRGRRPSEPRREERRHARRMVAE